MEPEVETCVSPSRQIPGKDSLRTLLVTGSTVFVLLLFSTFIIKGTDCQIRLAQDKYHSKGLKYARTLLAAGFNIFLICRWMFKTNPSVITISACLHLKMKKKNSNYRCKVHSTKLLTKYESNSYLKIFRRCRWHCWETFIREYLREFIKKNRNSPDEILRGPGRNWFMKKNLKLKISCQIPLMSTTLPISIRRKSTCFIATRIWTKVLSFSCAFSNLKGYGLII